MGRYTIPENYLRGFKSLQSLTKEEVSSIATVVQELPAGSGIKGIISHLEKKMPGVNATAIGRTVFSLGNFLENKDFKVDETAKDIAESYFEQIDEPYSEENVSNFAEKLSVIFAGSGNLKTTFKALGLLTSNEKIFKEARIISDVRLIFNDDLNSLDRHGIILHQLKVAYYGDGEESSSYFSLQTKDLHTLREQIERAIEKEKQMKLNYSDKINFIEVSE